MYFLVQLKRTQVPPRELVQFYVACIQSVLLYGCQAFHFSLPQYLSLTFERIQKRALRIIFGYEVHYHDALSRSGLVIVANPSNILHPLIPSDEECFTDLRNSRLYRAKSCKTNRCRDTFINKCASIFNNL